MYRVSPFTYFVEGMLGVAIANTNVVCADVEFLNFFPPDGQSCQEYIAPYQAAAGGYLRDPNATGECSYCTIDDTNVFLSSVGVTYANRWRDYGILWAFIVVNIFAAILFYWLFRVVSIRTFL